MQKHLEWTKGNWVQELLSVLWDNCTTTLILIGEPPFSLVYGASALQAIEADLPIICTLNYNIRGLHTKLDLIKELHEDARLHMTAFKRRWNLSRNSKVKPKQITKSGLHSCALNWLAVTPKRASYVLHETDPTLYRSKCIQESLSWMDMMVVLCSFCFLLSYTSNATEWALALPMFWNYITTMLSR